MNVEKAKELMSVIQADMDGKTTQTRNPGGDWFDCSFHIEREWRVKPEPREFWISRSPVAVEPTRYFAYDEKPTDLRIIHVREVLE